MKTHATISLIVTAIVVYGSTNQVSAKDVDSDWRTKQDIWWNDDEIVKDVLVSTTVVQSTKPQASSNPLEAELFSHAGDLLLLFDSMASPRSARTLASLAPYYLGEAAGEMYSCLVLRKGKSIMPALSQLASSNQNECIEKYGPPETDPKGAKISPCLSDLEYRKRLRFLIQESESNQSCTIER